MGSKKSSDDTQGFPVTDETDTPAPRAEPPRRAVEAWAEQEGVPATNWKVRATMAFKRWSEGELVTQAEYFAAMYEQMNQVTR